MQGNEFAKEPRERCQHIPNQEERSKIGAQIGVQRRPIAEVDQPKLDQPELLDLRRDRRERTHRSLGKRIPHGKEAAEISGEQPRYAKVSLQGRPLRQSAASDAAFPGVLK